jgi:hypothetical protein
MGPWLELSNWAARTLAIPGLKATGNYGVKRWWRRRFKRVFGSASHEYCIAYANLEVNSDIRRVAGAVDTQLSEFPLVKPTRPAMRFKAQKVVSGCELRALSYIGPSLVEDGGITGKVVSDEAISDRLDLDFISFGAMSNLKTLDAFSNAANDLAEYDAGFFVSKADGKPLCNPQPGFDYGIVLKIHPRQFPQRTWIACAGLGEWGTSGST